MLPSAPERQRVKNSTLGLCVAAGYVERATHTVTAGSAPIPGRSLFWFGTGDDAIRSSF